MGCSTWSRRPGRRSSFVAGLCLLVVGCAGTQSQGIGKPEDPDRTLQVDTAAYLKVFDNGLKLLVVPDPYTRVVAFDVRHQVGATDDPEGKAGLAHLAEHLMFQIPSDGQSGAPVFGDLPRHALDFNAFTGSDVTHYTFLGTAADVDRYMTYTRLRLAYDCQFVSEPQFARELEVVRNERRTRYQRADLEWVTDLLAAIYPEGHPHRRVLETDESLAGLTPDDACQFARNYYQPATTTVVVTGDVDPLEVLEFAKRQLEPLPSRDWRPVRPEVPELALAGRRVQIAAPVPNPEALLVYEIPPRFHPDRAPADAALELATQALGSLSRGSDGTRVELLRTLVRDP